MRGQVGYWGSGASGGMAVGFGEDMVRWLDRHAVDRRIFVSVSAERRVILLPDAAGGHVSSCGQSNGSPFRYVSCTVPGSLFLDAWLPPFEMLERDFEEEEGCLSCELPDDHDLPWPRLHLDCTTYDAEELAVEALQARLNSLVASGHTSFQRPEQRMPQRLHRLLPPGKYAECMATAKALASGGTL